MALDSDQCYLVLEYCQHGNLFEFLRSDDKYPALSERIRTSFMHDMASGLTYLHGRDRLHGDMKSLNVLVNGNFHKTCKLTDFDSSMRMREEGGGSAYGRGGQTMPWMAVELFNGAAISTQADVWALAIICWEVATRQAPFEDRDNPRADIIHHRMPALDPSWPDAWRHVMEAGWCVNPAHRPSAAVMAGLLKHALENNYDDVVQDEQHV